MRIAFSIFLCLIFFSTTNAQSILTGEAFDIGESYENLDENIAHYNLYQINIKKEDVNITSKNPFLNLVLGDHTHELNLYSGNLTTSFERENKPHLLGGSTRLGGLVSLTINDDFIFGFIKEGSSKIYIEPLRHFEKNAPINVYVVYNVAHVIENGEHVCGSDQVKGFQIDEEEISRMPTTMCKLVDYAIANTFDMVAAYSNVTGVMNFNLGVLNDVQTNYRSEFDANLEYDVVAHFVPSSSSNDPLSPNTSTVNASTLLSNFRNWARGPGNAGGGNSGGATGEFGVDYTMAGLWTDRDIEFNGNSGTVGLAYTPGWHHLLENYGGSAPSLAVMVSHEIGHNWNCLHDNTMTNIMWPSVLLTDVWTTGSQTSVNNRVSSQGYLDNCSTIGPPVGNFLQSAISVCTGSSIDFEDQSQYGETRSWEFLNGTPATSTSEKPNITYSTTGLHYAKITSTNGAGTDDFTNYVDIQDAPPSPCTPSGSGGSGGITNVSIANVSTTSSASGIYDDFSCSDIASVDPGTTYQMIVGVTGVSRIRYFVDYNNDGDFLDSGEASALLSFSGNGNLALNVTTSSSPVMAELLRFRIIVSTSTIAANGCTSPSTGQVEDYSMYFEVPQILGCTDPAATNYDPAATVDDGSCMYGTITWYRDFDNDTYGDPNVSQQSATQPAGYVMDNTDCDDMEANAFPGNPEVCDGIDNNCDGSIDEGVLITWYRDFDSDTFGNPNITSQACTQPAGFVADNTDCDDFDALEFPGQTWYKDGDGDDYSDGSTIIQCTRPAGHFVAAELTATTGDCDDDEPAAFPGNPEVCDGIDNNCDGSTDEGVLIMFFRDADNDDYGDPNVFTQACSQPSGYVSDNTDCDDSDASIFPGATELCDGVDNNCDGTVDEGLGDDYFRDLDNDGFGDPNVSVQSCVPVAGFVLDNTDCDDLDADEFPGQIWYRDFDGDMYGNGQSLIRCERPANYFIFSELISIDTDCDDNEANSYPGNTEICDGIDNNCDDQIDEGCGPDPDCDGVDLNISTITQDEYHAEDDIFSDAVIVDGQDILFGAQDRIDLNSGFEVETGAIFIADNRPCTTTSANAQQDLSDNSRRKLFNDLSDEIYAKFENISEADLVIYNKWGEEEVSVRDLILTNLEETLITKLELLSSGYYVLSVNAGDNKYVKTIMVE